MLVNLLISIFLLQLATSKQLAQTINVKQINNWKYLTKFGGDIGEVKYTIKIILFHQQKGLTEEPIPLMFRIYLDDNWEEVLQLPECERSHLSSSNQTLKVAPNGNEVVISGTLKQHVKRHMWFFVVEDCSKDFAKTFENLEDKAYIYFDFHILNSDGSEFTSEENGIETLIVFMSLLNIFFLGKVIYEIYLERRINEEWDYALILLLVAMIVEGLHNVFSLSHILRYSYNGKGFATLLVISDMLEVYLYSTKINIKILAAFLVNIILMMLSSGWSINFLSMKKFDILIPIVVVIGMLEMMIVGLGKIPDDHYMKYHKYEGYVGLLMSLLFLGKEAYFYMNIQLQRRLGGNVQIFMTSLGIYGSIYLLSFPFFITLSNFIAPYVRQKLIVYGTSFVRLFAMGMLTRLFSSKSSIYYQISYKNSSLLDRSKFE